MRLTGDKHTSKQNADLHVRGAEPTAKTSEPDTERRTDRMVFLAKDTPAEFLPQLVAIAAGDFAAAGLVSSADERAE
jgi:hypothetical protein